MNQTENPTALEDFLASADAATEEAPKFSDFLRFAIAEIRAAIQQGQELQKEIDAGKARINEAIARLNAA
jgi:hypothetical protein